MATQWFEDVHEDVAAAGIVFTGIGLVTPDSASVESVLSWANRLQGRVSYLIVENHASEHADLAYWHDAEQAKRFRDVFHPAVISMEFRLPGLGIRPASMASRWAGRGPANRHSRACESVAGHARARPPAEVVFGVRSLRELLLP